MQYKSRGHSRVEQEGGMSEWKELLIFNVVVFFAINGAVCLFDSAANWAANWIIRYIERRVK